MDVRKNPTILLNMLINSLTQISIINYSEYKNFLNILFIKFFSVIKNIEASEYFHTLYLSQVKIRDFYSRTFRFHLFITKKEA